MTSNIIANQNQSNYHTSNTRRTKWNSNCMMESSFQYAICECPDINASTMAVDVTGRFAVISGRKSIGLIDLDGNNCDGTSQGVTSSSLTKQNETNSSSASTTANQMIATSPWTTPTCKKVARSSKYEPTASHFNRHLTDLFAVTTYQVVEVLSIEDLNPLKPKLVLRGHSRAIADVEWSHFDPHILGSSGADCVTNLWDIRDSRRPSACLTSVSGATQVRFSKTSSNLIATSHEIDVRIWDIRQPNLPLYYLAAHLQKINGMDWNPNKNNCDHDQLITCSQDNTIKLWDLNSNKIRPSANLQTKTSAWRIRYTPVSPYAILTSTLPQLRSRTECMALKLWSMKTNRYEQKKLEMILGLVGHTDVIIDFDWRQRASNDSACEIVSWSKDHTLRVWRVDNQFIEMNVDNSDFEPECEVQELNDATSLMIETTKSSAGCLKSSTSVETTATTAVASKQDHRASFSSTKLESPMKSLKLSTTGNKQEADRESNGSDQDDFVSENPPTANELKQEFNLINKSIPNLEFEELNWLRRVCVVTARAKSVSCRLRIALPPNYPHIECPNFTIIDSNQYGTEGLSKEAKEKLLSLLNETAKSQLSRSRNCLEPCLRKFIAALQKITSHSSYRKRAVGSNVDYKDDMITLSAQRDHSVPFPSTSGAKFCGNLLVCFGRPMLPTINTSTPGADSANWLVETPRSMAQLSAQLDNMRRQGSYNLSNISISYFYYGAMRRAELQNRSSKNTSSGGGAAGSGTGGGKTSSRYLPSRSKSSSSNAQPIISKNYKCGPVIIYDVSKVFGGICRELAEDYVFDKDVIKMCRRNAEIAAAHNRRDLVQIWSLAELSSEGVLRSYVPNKDNERTLSLLNHDSDFGDRPWTMHPFGSKLIQSLIDHYVYNCHDVQTAAMLVWTFSSPKLGRTVRVQSSRHQQQTTTISNNSNLSNPILGLLSSSNNHKTIHGFSNYSSPANVSNKRQSILNNINTDTISDEWSFVNGPETHLYSNSWSNSHDEHQQHEMMDTVDGVVVPSESQRKNAAATGSSLNDYCKSSLMDEMTNGGGGGDKIRFPRLNILSPERSLQNDLIMHIYAELLYRLNLLNQRAMVLKNIGSNSTYSELFGNKQVLNDIPAERLPNLTIQCYNVDCRNKCHSVQCASCRKYSLYCSICRLPVKGSCSICLKCLHGGHVYHFNNWFYSYDFCPTGCGCKCLVATD